MINCYCPVKTFFKINFRSAHRQAEKCPKHGKNDQRRKVREVKKKRKKEKLLRKFGRSK